MNELPRPDRLKEWEPLRDKDELAYFCSQGFPINHNAMHWDFRVAGISRDLFRIQSILFILSKNLFGPGKAGDE